MDVKKMVYVANLPLDVTEEQVGDLFKQTNKKFKISEIQIADSSKTDSKFARVEMATEKLATQARNSMNGISIAERRIAVTPAIMPERDRLSTKQQKVADKIAAALEETEDTPVRQINAIVMLCGTNFAEAILEETRTVEEAGGIPRNEGEERRTIGGVFFYLARHRMPHEIRRIVYNRKGKMPNPEHSENGTGDDGDEE